MQKKKFFRLLTVWILCVVLMVGCNPIPDKTPRKVLSGFSVHYIDVGQGDCIFINLPDGKKIVIDSGRDVGNNAQTITEFLSTYSVRTIDYLIVSHPDGDHVGNTKTLIENFQIGKIYHPFIIDEMLYLSTEYKSTIELAKDKEIELDVSDSFDFIKGEDYQLIFLSPNPLKTSDSAYKDYVSTATPSEEEINNLSPIIYLEYAGVKFVFTGDAGKKQEMVALNNLSVLKSYYTYNELNVDLTYVDFLKVSHHGSADSTSDEFLQKLKPKNAVISVGGNNFYGHPSTTLIARLLEHSPNYNLYRTDVHGTVSVGVNEFGVVEVVKDNI